MKLYPLFVVFALSACYSGEAPLDDAAIKDAQTEQIVDTETEPPIRFQESEEDLQANAEVAQSSINPLENDLRGLEVAFRLPEAFAIKPGGALFSIEMNDLEGNALLTEVFDLEPAPGLSLDSFWAEQREGFRIDTFRLSPSDHDRMAATEAALIARRDAAPGQSMLNIQGEAKSCTQPGMTAPDTYSLTLYFRTAADVGFVPLTGEMLMDKPEDGPFLIFWDLCEQAG